MHCQSLIHSQFFFNSPDGKDMEERRNSKFSFPTIMKNWSKEQNIYGWLCGDSQKMENMSY